MLELKMTKRFAAVALLLICSVPAAAADAFLADLAGISDFVAREQVELSIDSEKAAWLAIMDRFGSKQRMAAEVYEAFIPVSEEFGPNGKNQRTERYMDRYIDFVQAINAACEELKDAWHLSLRSPEQATAAVKAVRQKRAEWERNAELWASLPKVRETAAMTLIADGASFERARAAMRPKQ